MYRSCVPSCESQMATPRSVPVAHANTTASPPAHAGTSCCTVVEPASAGGAAAVQAASSSAVEAATRTGLMPPSVQRGLCTRVVALAVGQAVGAAVDQAGNLHEVPAVGCFVDVAAGPVPSGDAGGVFRLGGQAGVVDQVQAERLAGLPIVVASGHLDVAAALVAHAVAGLSIAQVRAA